MVTLYHLQCFYFAICNVTLQVCGGFHGQDDWILVPVILATWIASRVDQAVRPRLADSVRFFTAPFIDLVVVGLATFLAIGPIAQLICSLIVIFFNIIANLPVVGGLLMGAFVGAVWQPLVILGFHWALIPIACGHY